MLLYTWNSEYVLHLRSMKKIGCRYIKQPNVFIDVFFYSKTHLHQLESFKLIIAMLKSLHVL